jgi:thiol-disulfide isomerase/thioredoxin
VPSKPLSALAAALVLAATLTSCSSTGADEPTRAGNQQGYVGVDRTLTRIPPDQRKPVPAVSGPALGSDKTVSTADYAGKVIVLNVWGSWCSPCREEAPDLQAASEATRGKAQFVGINIRDFSTGAPEAFVRTQKISYPSIFDPSGQTLLQLAGQIPPSAIPSTLIVDAQGRLAVRVLSNVSRITLVDMINDVAAGH